MAQWINKTLAESAEKATWPAVSPLVGYYANAPGQHLGPDACFSYALAGSTHHCTYPAKVVCEVVRSIPHSVDLLRQKLRKYMANPHLDHIVVVKCMEAAQFGDSKMMVAHYTRQDGHWALEVVDVGGQPYEEAADWFLKCPLATLHRFWSLCDPDRPSHVDISLALANLQAEDSQLFVNGYGLKWTQDVRILLDLNHLAAMNIESCPS